MNRRNYQRELEQKIQEIEKNHRVPKLLLHSCCAPCSSYVIEYLSQYFSITVFYYNPNIWPEEEYRKRAEEQKQFIRRFRQDMSDEEKLCHPITFLEGDYEKERFYQTVKGLEEIPEGGERCFRCYELRLREAAQHAEKLGMDCFTTTLSISPLKNAEKLNEIGEQLAEAYQVRWLPNDFKKKNGYKRSTELSREYDMYRQDYCGCVYSLKERRSSHPISPE